MYKGCTMYIHKFPRAIVNTLLLNGFTLTRTQLNIDTEYWTLKTENWKLKLNTEHWTLNTKHWKLNTEHRKLNTIYTEHYTAQSGEPPDICRWIFWTLNTIQLNLVNPLIFAGEYSELHWYYGIMVLCRARFGKGEY